MVGPVRCAPAAAAPCPRLGSRDRRGRPGPRPGPHCGRAVCKPFAAQYQRHARPGLASRAAVPNAARYGSERRWRGEVDAPHVRHGAVSCVVATPKGAGDVVAVFRRHSVPAFPVGRSAGAGVCEPAALRERLTWGGERRGITMRPRRHAGLSSPAPFCRGPGGRVEGRRGHADLSARVASCHRRRKPRRRAARACCPHALGRS